MSDSHHSQLRWSYFSVFSTAVLQLAASATITRFLQPSDYGLAAVAMLCYSMTGYFTQLGVARAIMQKPKLSAGNIQAAFTLALATGLAGFILLAALSPLLARYFEQPRLPPIIIAFGLNLIFQSLTGVSGGLLRREFRVKELSICDTLGYLLSTFGVGLPMAMKGFGVWALVGSNVSQPFIVMVLYFIVRPHPVLLSFKREDYAHITGFSGKASMTTAVEALGGSLDTIVMGRLVSPASLGLYNRSLTLSTQPGYNVSMGLSRVFYPRLSRAAEQGLSSCLRILKDSDRQLMSVVIPFCMAAAVAAPVIIPVIFGKQWTSAIPVYQVLCLVALLDASTHLTAIQLEVLSLFRNKFYVQLAFGLAFGAGILAFTRFGGILAVALVYVVLQALRSIGIHRLSARSLNVSTVSLYLPLVPGFVCGTILAAALYVIQRWLPGFHRLNGAAQLALLIGSSALLGTLIYRIFYRATVYTEWVALFKKSERDAAL